VTQDLAGEPADRRIVLDEEDALDPEKDPELD
jgi:hypothetical protein